MERSSDLASEWNKKQAAIEQDPRIVQIKGKANKAPKDEYLPFVRDFVQSGKWSEVNELENAGLIMQDGQFVIPDPEPEGFAEGGLVDSSKIGQLKASPRNQALGALADKLSRLKELGNKYQVLDQVPLLGGTGLGDLFLGQGPEEVSNWSYGNAPMQIPEMTRIPQIKKGRAESLADAVFMGADIGGLGALAGALGSKGLRNVAGSASRVGPKSLVPQVGAVKPKGGNWVMDLKTGVQTPKQFYTGSPRSQQEIFRALKKNVGRDVGEPSPLSETGVPWRGTQTALEGSKDSLKVLEQLADEYPEHASKIAPSAYLNHWVENTLKKYMKNEMGTPEDPIRELVDSGVTHYNLQDQRIYNEENLKLRRKAAGFPEEGFAKSDLGKRWEALSDSAIYERDVNNLENKGYDVFSKNPWLLKEGANPQVYGLFLDDFHEVGFNHLMDELANAVNPESGLPRDLLLKYDALPRVTVPQAVERVAKINDWRAKQKIEADLAKSTNPATQLFKEYPDQGFKWVELRPNPELDPEHKALREALKYEGDTMGHCVGGYCDGVVAGDSKIYSLRDAKGQPHVTIEVAPKRGYETTGVQDFDDNDLISAVYDNLPRNKHRGFSNWVEKFIEDGEYDSVFEALKDSKYSDFIPKPDLDSPPRIVQIKGKSNKAPKDEYLPFVRDFVQSGKWSEVNELENAGLIMKDGQFVIPDPEPEGFAEGGLVRSYNPEEIDQIVAQLIG